MILITLTDTAGSVPREPGAWMTVTSEGAQGSIGGGALEYAATQAARAMLQTGEASRDMTVTLGPDTGQCCGGRAHVELRFVQAPPPAPPLRPVYLIGAGHVGRALKIALTPLPFHPLTVDSRPETTPDILTPIYETAIAAAPSGAVFIVATHDHGLDLEAVAAVLTRGDGAFAGLIGSTTKYAAFKRRLAQRGIDIAPLICPIGVPQITGRAPAVIAASVAAQLLQELETWPAFTSCAAR